MDELFLKKLKKLRVIAPDKEYSRISRHAILQSRAHRTEPNPFSGSFLRFATIMAVLFVVVVISHKNNVPLKLAGLDAQDLRAEAKEVALNLELAQIATDSQNNKDINAALKETGDSSPGHLSPLLLQKEGEQITETGAVSSVNHDINKALEAISQ